MIRRIVGSGFLKKQLTRGFSSKNDLFGGIEEDLISKLEEMDQMIEKNGKQTLATLDYPTSCRGLALDTDFDVRKHEL